MTGDTSPQVVRSRRLSHTLGKNQQNQTTRETDWLTLYKHYIFTICYQEVNTASEGFLMSIKKLDDGRLKWTLDLAVATENASAGSLKKS